MKPLNNNTSLTKVSPEEYDMIMMSFDFIRYNRDITNDRLPDILLHFWSVPDFTTNARYEVNDARILVFMYILKLHFKKAEMVEKCLSTFWFAVLFYNFQVVLAATAYSRKTHIPIQPFKIFDVDEYISSNLQKPSQLMREYERITKTEKNK